MTNLISEAFKTEILRELVQTLICCVRKPRRSSLRLRTVEIATRMIQSGNVTLYDIADYTELPLDKVEDLAQKVRG